MQHTQNQIHTYYAKKKNTAKQLTKTQFQNYSENFIASFIN